MALSLGKLKLDHNSGVPVKRGTGVNGKSEGLRAKYVNFRNLYCDAWKGVKIKHIHTFPAAVAAAHQVGRELRKM